MVSSYALAASASSRAQRCHEWTQVSLLLAWVTARKSFLVTVHPDRSRGVMQWGHDGPRHMGAGTRAAWCQHVRTTLPMHAQSHRASLPEQWRAMETWTAMGTTERSLLSYLAEGPSGFVAPRGGTGSTERGCVFTAHLIHPRHRAILNTKAYLR